TGSVAPVGRPLDAKELAAHPRLRGAEGAVADRLPAERGLVGLPHLTWDRGEGGMGDDRVEGRQRPAQPDSEGQVVDGLDPGQIRGRPAGDVLVALDHLEAEAGTA